MHPNPAFRWADEAAMRAFVATHGFATLCIATSERPIVAHAPLIVGSTGSALFHLARSNRIVPRLDGATVVASILGADFYVSPDWYGSPDQVPTWNYVAVEIEGVARMLGEAELIAQVDALAATFERALAPKPAWTRGKMTQGRFEAMLRAIVGFEVTAATWRGTRKLGQNKSVGERTALADSLRAVGKPAEAAMVGHS